VGGGHPPGPIGRAPAHGRTAHNRGGGGTTHPRPVGSTHTPTNTAPTVSGWPRQIAWSEFREVTSAPDGATEAAQIDSEVQLGQHRVARDQGQLRLAPPIQATLSVKRSNSWVVTSQKSADLLAHEQGHYDITGLNARDLVGDLDRIRAASARDLQQQVTQTMNAAQALASKLTTDYDTDTNHGLKTDRQQKWQTHLAALKQSGGRLTAGPP